VEPFEEWRRTIGRESFWAVLCGLCGLLFQFFFFFEGRAMHLHYRRAHELSGVVIGAAIEVHRTLGPGLLESIYERCLAHELSLRGVPSISQQLVRVRYKDIAFDEVLKFDLAVDDCLLVEVKAVQEVHPVHKAQTLSYMRLLDFPLGLILNFHELRLQDGLHRMILPGAGKE
jgi:GxxExxY protein